MASPSAGPSRSRGRCPTSANQKSVRLMFGFSHSKDTIQYMEDNVSPLAGGMSVTFCVRA